MPTPPLKIGDEVRINIAPHYGPDMYREYHGRVSIIIARHGSKHFVLDGIDRHAWRADELVPVDTFREHIRNALNSI